jgi:hypothetical protein
VNRACRRRRFLRINLILSIRRNAGCGQHDWKKRRRCRRGLVQFAPFQSATPLEYLVRVHTVSASHQRNTRTRLECQFRDPPLLRHRSEPARAPNSPRFLFISHDGIVVLKPQVMPEGRSGRLHRFRRGSFSNSSRASLKPRWPGKAISSSARFELRSGQPRY